MASKAARREKAAKRKPAKKKKAGKRKPVKRLPPRKAAKGSKPTGPKVKPAVNYGTKKIRDLTKLEFAEIRAAQAELGEANAMVETANMAVGVAQKAAADSEAAMSALLTSIGEGTSFTLKRNDDGTAAIFAIDPKQEAAMAARKALTRAKEG